LKIPSDAIIWGIINSTESSLEFIAESYKRESDQEWEKFYSQYQKLNPPRPEHELYWESAQPVPLSEIMPNKDPRQGLTNFEEKSDGCYLEKVREIEI